MRCAAAFVLAAVVLPSGVAHAGEFDSSGAFSFSVEAALTFDFEDAELPPLADPSAQSPLQKLVTDALSGSGVIELLPYENVTFSVAIPAGLATYRASVWIRGGEATASVSTTYDGTRRDEVAALFPTGRMTSDGWVELANERIVIDGKRGPIHVGVFAPDGCEADAFELVVDGTAVTEPGRPCDSLSQPGACDAEEICTWGACRRVRGWVPPIPAERALVTEYLGNRLRFLFGPYSNRSADLPAAEVAIEAMRHAQNPWAYWNAFLLGLRRLHDGHTSSGWSPADYIVRNPKPLDVCFIEGDGDASHTQAPSNPDYRDVLVSHAGALRNLGLRSGDRLVRVDGRHPIAWARSLIEVSWSLSSASNHSTFAEQAAALRGLISRYAKTLDVVRCDANGCGDVESIDLAKVPALASEEPFDSQLCDSRIGRHVPGAPANHQGEDGVFAGFLNEVPTQERFFGIEWDSLYTTTGQDGIGAALTKAVARIQTEGAAGVVFDHRRGTGGTLAGPQIIWNYAVKRHPLTFFQTRERAEDEQPSLAEGMALFSKALTTFDVDEAGTNGAAPVPTALLITDDVSASDWLPLGLKGQPNMRIFGPYQTSGAFSTRLSLGYWLGLNYTLASGDSFVADGHSLNGFGVEPDVVVLPRQSDLMLGKDTVYEAALAWLRSQGPSSP